ncbi:MAG: LysE family translocator [Planctomycetaceae bacterium]|nr:LysE family translocator [Planctomycetaceae bacterium]
MMPLLTSSAVLGFATASFVITICPGPSWIYTITAAVRQNGKAGLFAVMGNATGICCHVTAAASGLAALMAVSPTAYGAVKWAGVCYVAWLGLRMLWNGPSLVVAGSLSSRTYWQVYRGGVLVNVLNPKVSILMLALMPQFVDATRGSTTLQILLLGSVHGIIATAVLSILVLIARRGVTAFQPVPLFSQLTRWGTGTILLLFSLKLAVG